MLDVGSQVPDLELETTMGRIRLGSLRGRKLVIYFFPKAFTQGCTRELERFTELYDDFVKLGVEVIGVSADRLETQRRFAERHGARFPLASDTNKTIINAFGVLNERGTGAKRVTFVIDEHGVVRAVVANLRRAEEHADRALEVVKSLG